MKRIFFFLSICLISLCAKAQISDSHVGAYTNDLNHTIFNEAYITLLLNEKDVESTLRLIILPDRDATIGQALVDTTWVYGSRYRTEPTKRTGSYEEKNIFLLYTFDTEGYISHYIVFNYLVDKKHPESNQVVIRRCNADAEREWCAAFKATPEEAKAFFNILSKAERKMGLRKTDAAKFRRYAPNNDNLDVDGDVRVSRPQTTIGRGSAYGSSW